MYFDSIRFYNGSFIFTDYFTLQNPFAGQQKMKNRFQLAAARCGEEVLSKHSSVCEWMSIFEHQVAALNRHLQKNRLAVGMRVPGVQRKPSP